MPWKTKCCGECGAEFTRYRAKVSKEPQFCSRSCFQKNRGVGVNPRVPSGTGSKPVKGENIPCVTCGTPVYRNANQKKANKRFCSIDCYDAAQTGERVHKLCETCGQAMELKLSQKHRRYCSKLCYGDRSFARPLDWTHNGRQARLDSHGYIMVWEPDHPKANKGWYSQHRLLVEQVAGRVLERHEHVHHANENKTDNRLENLEVMDSMDHIRLTSQLQQEARKRVQAELAEYRRRYGPLEDWSYEQGQDES